MNTSLFNLQSLESRLLMSGEPVLSSALLAGAQNVDLQPAGAISVNASLESGQDLYQFTTPATGRMYIDMSALDGGLDSYLSLYDSQGRRIRVNNNASGETLDSRLGIQMKPGRTYYVAARSVNGTSGAYTMRWTSLPKDDLGNTAVSSRNLGLRSRVSRFAGRINYDGDVDMLAFTANKTGTMTVSLNAIGRLNFLDPLVTVLDANGQQLAQDDDSGPGLNSVVTLNVQAGQTYYIQAAAADSSVGRYQLNVAIEEAAPVPPQPPAPPVVPPATDDTTLPSPASSITTEVITTDSGLQLVITGTNANDTIVVAQSDAGLTLTSGSGTRSFEGAFTSVVVYAFAGNDTVRFTSTVTASGLVYGGDGNDSIYLAGLGTVSVLGGSGDDLMVSIGGGIASLTGGEGTDSYWLDTADGVLDATAAEQAVGAVHRVGEFYQPYGNAGSPDYIPLTLAGQNFRDPTLTSYARGYANYANRSLFVDGPEYNDIVQGGVGDCYYLASLASLSQTDPQILRQAVTSLGDGTYAVRFYRGGQSVYVRVDGDLPVTAGGSLAYAKASPDGETWVAIMEKAYAFFRYGQNSYGSINGGWMSDVFIAITGTNPSSRTTSGSAATLFTYLQNHLAAGHAPTLASYYSASGPIVGSHAYMVKSVQQGTNGMTVTVYNPWGVDGKSYDSNYNDGLLTLSMAQVQQYFSAVVTSLA